jgi:predicted amidohydrolase YtcJ
MVGTAFFRLAMLAACASPGMLAAQAQPSATLYRAARIYTMEQDSLYTAAPAVAVRGGLVLAVGDSAAVAATLAEAGTPYRVDTRFADDVLFPGFVEAHSHMQLYGFVTTPPVVYVGYWDWTLPDGTVLPGVPTVDSLVSTLHAALATRADSTRADSTRPLLAYGADPIYFGGTRLGKDILDRASGTTPIVALLSSGHIAAVNTPMLRLIQQDTVAWNSVVADPHALVGGAAAPTGEFDEVVGVHAVQRVILEADSALARGFVTGGLTQGAALMRAAGITTATDLYFGGGPSPVEKAARHAYVSAAAADSVFPRVFLAYGADALARNYGDTAAAYLRGVQRGDTDKIRTGPVKVVFDGSIQGYTGVLSTPYAAPPPPGANPTWNVQPGSITALLRPFWNAGFRVAVHVNGDSATQMLIEALDSLQAGHPRADHRTTFEHNQSAFERQYDAIAARGGTVNLFPGHVYFWGPQHERYTLGTRAADIAAADWAVERGIPFSLHSDAPVTQAAPLFLAWSAVNRIMPTPGDSVLGASHRITVGQAMRAITWGGAYLLGADSVIGSIRPGKYADFTVLAQDPFAADPVQLCAIPVVATVVGGVVWQAPTPRGACPSRPGGGGPAVLPPGKARGPRVRGQR